MVKRMLAVLMVVAMGLGVMGCSKAELKAKDKEIAGLKEQVTALETEKADLQAKVASLEEQVAAAEAGTKKAVVNAQKRSSKRRR